MGLRQAFPGTSYAELHKKQVADRSKDHEEDPGAAALRERAKRGRVSVPANRKAATSESTLEITTSPAAQESGKRSRRS